MKASINQTSFLGGQWGPLSQGRSDDPKYSTAMRVCLNGYPVEEGAWIKRSGTEWIVQTYGSTYANILPFTGSSTCAFCMEFTSQTSAGALRFLTQSSLAFTNDGTVTITGTNTSTGVITVNSLPGDWNVGDQVYLVFPSAGSSLFPYPMANEAFMRNQIATINTLPGGNTLTISNWGFGASPAGALVGAQIIRVLRLATPYTGGPSQLQSLRAIQAEINAIILCPTVAPYEVQITKPGTLSTDPAFSFNALTFIDGPYLDPQAQTLSLSGTSGTVTATAGSAAFAATDVGRAIRIFTQPALWAAGTTYTAGNVVTDSNGAWWTATASSTGVVPGQLTTVAGVTTVVWAPNPTAGSWAWGLITAYTDSTHVSVTFDTTIPNMALQSANGTTAYSWQLGVYSGTTGYPTCGTYYEGRLVLGGCIPNEFEMSCSNGFTNVVGDYTVLYSPTDPYGTVLDSSGITLTLNSADYNQIQWMVGDNSGILMGTLAGEHLVAASALGDPITPTSIQAHEYTHLGSENIEACRAGMAVVFAQKYGRRVIEYLADTFSGKFTGRHLNENAKDLTVSGVARLIYQEEPVPLVWALMNNGMLAGCTYRRFSRLVAQPPEAAGWHWHMHGAGNKIFTSMCSVPGKGGLLDRLFVVTNDAGPTSGPPFPSANNYNIEIMQPMFDAQQSLGQGWFVDESPGPGPGNSQYDCGGGNMSTFAPTGGLKGADSVPTSGPAFNPPNPLASITPGQSPPAGGLAVLSSGEASFFPGTVSLYNLPKWLTSGSLADVSNISMSFWVGKFDASVGALLSSPELAPAEIGNPAGPSVSEFFSNQGGTGGITASMSLNGGYPYPGDTATSGVAGTGNTAWVHVMLSARSNGDGTITAILVCNDTLSTTVITNYGMPNAIKLLPFLTSQDAQKENGLAVWNIGGAAPVNVTYDTTYIQTQNNTTYKVPPLVDILPAAQKNAIVGGSTGVGIGLGYSPSGALTPSPTVQGFWDALFVGSSYQVTSTVVTTTTGGGISSLPYGGSGYIGSVAELWVMPGQYIDWTNSTNRYKFHEYDSITESWGPIYIGPKGALPGFGTPWIYCAGPPDIFPLNRATNTYLTEIDTTSGLVDYQAGLGGGLTVSPLNFPI